MATISITREELMGMLLKAKGKAEKEDSRKMAEHEADEVKTLKKFHSVLKEALCWDYKTAKKKRFDIESVYAPSCPERSTAHIEIAIAELKADSRKGRFNLASSHDWYAAAMWLPESERPKKSLCD